jgi:DeoR/GlpR family transcriptional regulator of sugar metabolism
VDDLSSRMAWHYEVKQRLALKAIEDVQDNETVMIESGSCCALVALALMSERKGITLITNSSFIADFVRKQCSGRIILLGGEYQPESQCNVGPITRMNAQKFFVDKFFIGTDGFSIHSGFTSKDYMRAETVRDMAEQAEHVIVVTQSAKFDQVGTVSLIDLDKVSQVITDSEIPEHAKEYLLEKNIQLKTVDSQSD